MEQKRNRKPGTIVVTVIVLGFAVFTSLLAYYGVVLTRKYYKGPQKDEEDQMSDIIITNMLMKAFQDTVKFSIAQGPDGGTLTIEDTKGRSVAIGMGPNQIQSLRSLFKSTADYPEILDQSTGWVTPEF